MATSAMGTTLTYRESAGAQSATRIGLLTSIGEIACDSEAIDVTTLESEAGFRQYAQGLRDGGEVSLTGFHSKDEGGQALLRALYATGAAGYFTVAFPDGAQVNFTAFVKRHALGAASVEGAVSFAAVLRTTGPVEVA